MCDWWVLRDCEMVPFVENYNLSRGQELSILVNSHCLKREAEMKVLREAESQNTKILIKLKERKHGTKA